MNALYLLPAACLFAVSTPTTAAAEGISDMPWNAKERFQIRGRIIGILADGDGTIDTTTTRVDVEHAYVPEVDFSYFFTDHIAAEAVVATAQHTITAGGGEVGDTWILPPTVVLQYHFQRDKKFSPYVGAGINYSLFYGEDEATGFTNLDVDGGFGWTLQAGADYWINDNWGLNFDVKYVDLNIDASVNNGGALTASDVALDPVIAGVGVSYRF